jgi:rubredoxin
MRAERRDRAIGGRAFAPDWLRAFGETRATTISGWRVVVGVHSPSAPYARPSLPETMAFAVSASAVGRVAFLGANSGLKASTPSGPRSTGRGGVVTTRAFFNFGGVKQPKGVAMVCRDCGYVYRGMDFNDLPRDYKCPPCGSGKNAFRPEKKVDFVKDGFNAPGARAAKKANQQAFRAKREAARKKAEAEARKRR